MELPSFPKGNLRQTLFFSATFTEDMLKIAKEFMRSEGFRAIVSNRKNVVNKKCEQEFVAPEPTKKFAVLVDFLRNELAKGFLKKTLVFANTKEFVEKLCVALTFSGIIAKSISSIKSQNVREKNLELFKNFSRDGAEQLDVLVVSDVCARGIDIKELDLVINFDMPNDYDTYIHRAGRVGRIRQGKCISYVSNRSRQISLLKEIKQAMEKSGQIVPPSLEEILRAEEVKESQPSFGQNIENSFANDVNNKTEEPAADIPTEKVNDKAVEVDNVEKKEEENKPEVSETVANAVDEKVDTAPVEAGNVEEKVDNAAGEEAVASAVDAEKKVDTAAGETVAPDFSTEVVEKEKKSFESDW
uniref:Helicase C-terminal domain-containing protein n=1 Tax=Panagrolaimus sp. ES5 TaxID=591445 RepID=A0AC34F1F6_9BILA